MFGWIASALGSALKKMLQPVGEWVAHAVYGVVIEFPLQILNFLNTAFLFLSGSAVDKILFNTSIQDGGIKMNFFSNPSPMQHFYIITFSIAGAMGGLFLVLATIKTITASKMGSTHGSLTAAGRITG